MSTRGLVHGLARVVWCLAGSDVRGLMAAGAPAQPWDVSGSQARVCAGLGVTGALMLGGVGWVLPCQVRSHGCTHAGL